MKAIVVIILGASIAACAAQPPAGSAGGEKRAPDSAAVAGAHAAGASAAPAADEVNKSYLKLGYRAVHRDGKVLYCQTRVITGSLISSTVCLSDAEMKASEQIRQQLLDNMQRTNGPACGASATTKCN